MRAVVQRVTQAYVEVAGEVTGRIEKGLLVYVGVGVGDTGEDARWLAGKIANLRIFTDGQGRLNRSALDVGGEVLAISNFTLLADARKGRRPAFVAAADGAAAEPIHRAFLDALQSAGVPVSTGIFGAEMTIHSQADGPVNLVIDSPQAGASRAPD